QITPTGTDGHHDLTITSPTGLHATGILTTDTRPETHPGLTAWPPPGAEPADISDLYPALTAAGYDYGPTFHGLQTAWTDGDHVYADVALPEGTDTTGYGIHPALLDAALHAMSLTHQTTETLLPFAFTDVRLHASDATHLRVHLTRTGEREVRVDLSDAAGAPVATIGQLGLRAVDLERVTPTPSSDGLLEVRWGAVSMPADVDVEGFAQLDGTGLRGLASFTGVAGVLAAADPPTVLIARVPGGTVRETTTGTLTLVQDFLAAPELADTRLMLLTDGGVVTEPGERLRDPAQAAVGGLIRAVQAEHPGRLLLLDGVDAGPAELAAAVRLQEPELAYRDGRLLAPRLASLPVPPVLPPDPSWRLEAGDGTLEGLAVLEHAQARAPLAPGEVRIAIRAAGINFRDAMIALGMYPDQALLGSEGAGVVVETGAAVTDFAPGDRVMGLLPGSFGPMTVADHRMLARVPDGWSFAQAAAVPVVYTTAYYALVDLGGLLSGERVLVHSAAGGVGMAATQLARHFGAEVFGTASQGKWEVLRRNGFDDAHLASSRTTDFEAEFSAATDGRGVDVVLNSLAGDFVDASLRLLPRGGRFLEMGKTDIRAADRVSDDHAGVHYRAFDAIEAGPDRIREILREVLDLFARGVLTLPPIGVWDVRAAGDALRFVSQARHVGKVVLTVPAPLDPDGTVLISGGTGALGGLLARHLVDRHGARNLLLVSRSGDRAEGATALAEDLRGLGAAVTLAACDLGDRTSVEKLLADVPAEHPLTAVVHAAGVVDDALVERQSPERLDTVFRPKTDAARHLHELTATSDLAAFVLFSSVAGVFGSPGQSNYAAANAYLDALARQRRGDGLPALSIAWGFWAQRSAMTGHLSDADRRRIARSGMRTLSADEGLALFDEALARPAAAPVAGGIDLTPLRGAEPAAVPALLRDLVGATPRRTAAAAVEGGGTDLTVRLAALPAGDRDRYLLDLVRAHTATVLGHAGTADVPATAAFKELGFDSLAAVELRNRLATATGLRLPATLAFDHPSPAAVGEFLLGELAGTGAPSVLAELDRLEALLLGVDEDAELHAEVAVRLQNLSKRWTATAVPEERVSVADDLDAATDDEVFDFIGKELGIS
ncbi:SDR family NAD(P)-dependent oxidoreductase, partial [Micromonospora sp. DT231]|uniref:SDR family NAD(P)-dependent oxidoreductase n=1 Tax=Micromonospora sp. DT231 TaxID=3416526 RepID=UPI003CF640A7